MEGSSGTLPSLPDLPSSVSGMGEEGRPATSACRAEEGPARSASHFVVTNGDGVSKPYSQPSKTCGVWPLAESGRPRIFCRFCIWGVSSSFFEHVAPIDSDAQVADHKSPLSGICFSMSSSFHARRHFLMTFSLSIAEAISANSSTCTSLCTPYFFVKPPKLPAAVMRDSLH